MPTVLGKRRQDQHLNSPQQGLLGQKSDMFNLLETQPEQNVIKNSKSE